MFLVYNCAANGTPISVLGIVKLRFPANGVGLFEDLLLVSEDIHEVIHGFHWLKRNGCQWVL